MEPAEEDGTEESYVSIDISDATVMSSIVVETVEISTSNNPQQMEDSSEVVMPENVVLSNMDRSLDNDKEGEGVIITEIVNSDTTFWEVFLDDCRAFENCTIHTADGKFRFPQILCNIFSLILIRFSFYQQSPSKKSYYLISSLGRKYTFLTVNLCFCSINSGFEV